jgi:hypothetical protein
MKLPKFIISIAHIRNGTHVLEDYCAENAIIAAYLVAENEIGIDFGDSEDRSEFDWDEVVDEFREYGYSIKALQL